MKKFKIFCAKFLLHVYIKYIREDWDEYTLFGKICIYPAWFVKSTLIWMISPMFLPEYWFKNSKLYKEIKKITNSPEYQQRMFNF